MLYGCLKCGYQWKGRIKSGTIPKACPDCKNRGSVIKMGEQVMLEIEFPIKEIEKAKNLLNQYPKQFKDINDVFLKAMWLGQVAILNAVANDKNWEESNWLKYTETINSEIK